MTSKGVSYYFNVGMGGIQATAFNNGSTKPDFSKTFAPAPGFQTGNVQIELKTSTSLYGSFNWSTKTSPVVSANVTINPLTGNVGSGSLANMMNTPSVLAPDFAVSFGFYDSGPGYGGLTNQDQVYSYLSAPVSNWMGQLAAASPQVQSAPFCRFALPGSHDAGTFDLAAVKSLLSDASAAAAFLGLLSALLGSVAASQALTAITNLAVTQKDNVVTQLNLGCRYFDFRPGYAPSEIKSFIPGIYHQHSMIPGYPFGSFLTDVLRWLATNKTEIVVVSANDQGFLQDDMTPPDSVLASLLTEAQSAAGTSIAIGSAADLRTTYGELLTADKRLIFLNQIGDWYPSKKYDSYSDSAYATLKPQPIIDALRAMTQAKQAEKTYTVMQLQGTATNVNSEIIAAAVASLSSASSPLMSTKALFDTSIYPWLAANVATQLDSSYLVVFLNDFIDNTLAQTAMAITKQRITG
jgi:hypothetical protein